MIAIPTDQYDKDGNMLGIEFNDEQGKFIVFAEWDEREEQTSEKRIEFRKWAYDFIKDNLGYEVKK
jgi:hypothetical protein